MKAAWIDALMAKFARIWGPKWTDHVAASGGADAVAAEWRDGLAGMTGEQVRTSLDYCRANLTWPPSIAEFRQGGVNAEQSAFLARLREADDAYKALPRETWAETKARGAAKLAELRAQLRKANA
jgi:hypothetical protein